MQIGELSQHTDVNIETIRYYERVGVLPEPSRQSNGRRTSRSTHSHHAMTPAVSRRRTLKPLRSVLLAS